MTEQSANAVRAAGLGIVAVPHGGLVIVIDRVVAAQQPTAQSPAPTLPGEQVGDLRARQALAGCSRLPRISIR